MGKTLQQSLLEKGLVKPTQKNKAYAEPFIDKEQLNRHGKPARWKNWIKTGFPNNIYRTCCMCGRKEREGEEFSEDPVEFIEMMDKFTLSTDKIIAELLSPKILARICQECEEYKNGSSNKR